MRDYTRERENRLYYLSRGRCPVCGGLRPVVEGSKWCEVCRDKNCAKEKERRDKRRAEGLCVRCGEPLGDDKHVQCEKCRARDRELKRRQSQYYIRKEKGMCVSCGARAARAGKVLCSRCAMRSRNYSKARDPGWAKQRAMREARKAAGLCVDCGKPSEGLARCSRCREMRHESVLKYRIMKKIREGKI